MKTWITHAVEQWHSAESEGIQGFRIDVPQSGELTDFLQPLVGVPLDLCFILHDISRNEVLLDAVRDTGFDTSRSYIEPFNEREEGRVTPQVMIDAIKILYHDCEARGYQGRIVASGDSNLNNDALAFYKTISLSLPDDCIVACHDYPKGTQDQYKAWHGTHERDIELFLAAIGKHPPACSEFGFHMAEETRTFLTSVVYHGSLSEQDVYDRLMEYLKRYAHYGFLFSAIYQWGDGTGTSSMDLYGLHHLDLSPKRQLAAVKDWRVAA